MSFELFLNTFIIQECKINYLIRLIVEELQSFYPRTEGLVGVNIS